MLNKFHRKIAAGFGPEAGRLGQARTQRFSNLKIAVVSAFALTSVFSPGAVLAGEKIAESPWVVADNSRARLISAVDSIGGDGRIQIGFQVDLDSEWHFYWRTKSESGIPPKFDWSKSENVDHVDVAWPAPQRLDLGGFEAIAYLGNLVLPMIVTVIDPTRPAVVHLSATFAVCKDICVLHDEEFALHLDPGDADATRHAALIADYAAMVPTREDIGRIVINDVRLITIDSAPVLEVYVSGHSRWRNADIFVEGQSGTYFRRPEVRLSSYGRVVRFRSPVTGAAIGASDAPLILTIVGSGAAVERRLMLSPVGLSAN